MMKLFLNFRGAVVFASLLCFFTFANAAQRRLLIRCPKPENIHLDHLRSVSLGAWNAFKATALSEVVRMPNVAQHRLVEISAVYDPHLPSSGFLMRADTNAQRVTNFLSMHLVPGDAPGQNDLTCDYSGVAANGRRVSLVLSELAWTPALSNCRFEHGDPLVCRGSQVSCALQCRL